VLFELAHQARHFAPVAQALFGAHAEAQGGDMATLARGQLLQGFARVVETALLDGELGFGHQPGRLQSGCRRGRARAKPIPSIAPDRAGREPRASRPAPASRRGLVGACLFGATQRMAVTPFLQQAPGVAQGNPGLFLLATAAELRHGTRQAEGVIDGARQEIEDGKGGQRREQEQVERHFRTPGRQHQQHIALVVARGKRKADGERGEDQQPEQCAHLRPTLPLRRAPGRT
jgi:hypothetical protein